MDRGDSRTTHFHDIKCFQAMEGMTGQPDMSTDAMREYFLPLEKWLKKENKKNGVRVGWDHDDSKVMCSDQTSGQATPPQIQNNDEE